MLVIKPFDMLCQCKHLEELTRGVLDHFNHAQNYQKEPAK